MFSWKVPLNLSTAKSLFNGSFHVKREEMVFCESPWNIANSRTVCSLENAVTSDSPVAWFTSYNSNVAISVSL